MCFAPMLYALMYTEYTILILIFILLYLHIYDLYVTIKVK